MPSDAQAFIQADARGQWFVIATDANRNRQQNSGQWIKTQSPVEIRR